MDLADLPEAVRAPAHRKRPAAPEVVEVGSRLPQEREEGKLKDAGLTMLSREVNERIQQALEEAESRLRDVFLERALKAKLKPALIERTLKDAPTLLNQASLSDRNNAALRYLDAMAWECMCSSTAAEFTALIGEIGDKASLRFDGDAGVVETRKQEWLAEAREREAPCSFGDRIPPG